MFALIAMLALLPFAVLADVLAVRRWHIVPLQQKNMTRATAGAFMLVLCLFLAANGFPVIGWQATAAIAALALLYLVAGIHGARGARFDPLSVFWWGALGLGCGALLVFIEGFRL
jgi:hypothetical protein